MLKSTIYIEHLPVFFWFASLIRNFIAIRVVSLDSGETLVALGGADRKPTNLAVHGTISVAEQPRNNTVDYARCQVSTGTGVSCSNPAPNTKTKKARIVLPQRKMFVYLINGKEKHAMKPPIPESNHRDVLWRTFEVPIESGYPNVFAPGTGYGRSQHFAEEGC